MLSKRYENDGNAFLKLNELQSEMKNKIDNKVRCGIYDFENIDCPICGNSKDYTKISQKDRYGLHYPVVCCKKCGLVVTNPRMTQKSYDQFYTDEYRKLYNGTDKPTDKFFQDQYRKGKKIYKFLPNLPESTYILEVGCGAGGILYYLKEKGFKVKGIDIGEEYIQYGIKKGLDLEACKLQNLKLDIKPDLIIYSHVFEHILDVKNELTFIKQNLHENGMLYIEVPGLKNVHNSYMDFMIYLQNAHTYHFTLETLNNLVHIHGFELSKGNQFVRSLFKRSTHTSSFESQYESTMEYLQNLESGKYKDYSKILVSSIKNFLIKLR